MHKLGAVSRQPRPEVHVPRQLPRTRLRSTAAVCTTMSALAATSLITAPSVAEPFSPEPCALQRTAVHHSEGLDT